MSQKHPTIEFNQQRQRVLSYLPKLKSAIDAGTSDLACAIVERFCDTLVDYLSLGHFRIFDRLVPVSHQYAAIEHTTRELMRFNDRFGNGVAYDLAELSAALEQTALVIDARLEVEDDLLHPVPLQGGRVATSEQLAIA